MLKLLNWLKERILFIGVVVLLVFIPLYPKFPLFEVPGTYVAIRFEDFLVAFLVGVFILKTLGERTNIFQDRLNRLIFAYFVVGGLSSLSAIMITKNVIPHLVLLHWVRRIEYMLLFFIAAASVRKMQDVKDYLVAIFLATAGVIIYGLGQKFLGFPVISTMNEEFSKGVLLSLSEWARVNSTFAGHYDLAAYLVLVLAVTVGGIIGFASFWQKIFTLIFGIFTFYLLILTASQISFIAYLVGITAVLVFSKKYFWIIPVLSLSILAIFTSSEFSQRYATTLKINLSFLSGIYKSKGKEKLVLLPTPTPPPPPSVVAPLKPKRKVISLPTPTPTPIEKKYVYYGPTEPTEPIELTAYRSVKIRFNVEWPRAIRAFKKNPLLGTGYSSITLATDNDYLRALGETGILGFVALLLIFLEIARRVFEFLPRNGLGLEKAVVIGISGAALGFLINAFFIDVFEASKVAFVFWILVGIMVGVINISMTTRMVKNE
ncbi:MAG: O-antigen ligase family protein [Patescibacteria group bacterium]